jgi:hypothetical protein
VSVNFILLFFSNSALYGEAVMIFAEPDLDDFLHLALVVPCFEFEDSGFRRETLTTLPVEAVGVAEGDSVGSCERTVGKSEGARNGFV